MIRFFRNIRQKLAAENKAMAYLRYAIGEILLVVIGILIALQVNNWIIQRINNNLEKEYISRLIDELHSDIKYFNKLQSEFRDKEEKMDRILGIWKSEGFIIKDSLQYISDFISAGDISPWYNEPVTWTQLVQTGDLKIIKNKTVVDNLFSYYSNMKKAAVNYEGYTYELVNEARRKWIIPFTVKSYEYNIPSFIIKKVPSAEVFKSIHNNLSIFKQLYTSIGITCNLHTWESGEFVRKASELSEQLKTYLDSK